MPAARLNDSQKAEVVERFRAGEGLQPLADAYGCSPNTVSRVVKAALDPGEYDRLKQQRNRRSASPGAGASDAVEIEPSAPDPEEPAGDAQASGLEVSVSFEADSPAGDTEADSRADAAAAEQEDGPVVLAIEDADDFGDDEADDDLAFDMDGDDSDGQAFVPVPLLEVVDDHTELRPLPLTAADLRGSAWMLVDKTVELQARPLSEFTELGRLPAEEQDRQALMVFVNPRQAKRHCGRTQRVIKIPDPAVFTRTAPYLLAQGISRVVIEGALFALPGS